MPIDEDALFEMDSDVIIKRIKPYLNGAGIDERAIDQCEVGDVDVENSVARIDVLFYNDAGGNIEVPLSALI